MSEGEDFTGVMPVREAHRFDTDRLTAWMKDHVDGFRGPLHVEPFKGGQSSPTDRLTSGDARYVVRRKPPGKLLLSAHAVGREYRVITALGQTDVPVPRTYGLCADGSVIGTAYHALGRSMRFAAQLGRLPRRRLATPSSSASLVLDSLKGRGASHYNLTGVVRLCKPPCRQ